MPHSVENLTLPFTTPIWEPVRSGTEFHIHGKVHLHHHHGNDKVFAIELLSGPNIVLHLSFRFYDHHTIVLNASGPGGWQSEERVDNPLTDGEHFHLHIHVHHSHYEIKLNGHDIASFQHRFPYESIQAVGAHGAAIVDKVTFDGFHFEQDWNRSHDNYDYGHQGYIGYGSSAYQPPQFQPNHPHRRHFGDRD
uniref:Galectin n=1 Tax=Panagrellus redivivus TaxID=6233 RepID=A0A7E4UZC1_PANRE